jgi:dTDP-4-dehydrorhamnose 3,5-epimerase
MMISPLHEAAEPMQIESLPLPGVLVVEPRVFADARGFFMETHQKQKYAAAGIAAEFVQDNLSRSCRGTLRGLHYQLRHPQGKLVQVFDGEVFDVAVDVRRDSPTFGRWSGTLLSGENRRQLWIPPGFAHGFCVLSESALMFYKCTDYYHPEHERTLLWNDPAVGIEWPLDSEPILSDKDRRGLPLDEVDCYESTP